MRGKGVEGLKLHAMPCSNFFLFYYYYCLFFACTTTGPGCSNCGKALPCWVSDKHRIKIRAQLQEFTTYYKQ